MKSSVNLNSYVLFSTLLITACGSGKSENSTTAGFLPDFRDPASCATATALKPGEKIPLFFAKTMVEDILLQLPDDSFSNYGVELSREVVKKGGTGGTGLDERHVCTRAFVLVNGQKSYLESAPVTGSLKLAAAKASSGYLLLQEQKSQGSSTVIHLARLDLTTGRRSSFIQETVPANCGFGLGVHASPAGTYFVTDRSTKNDCNDDNSTWRVSLQLYNAKAEAIGQPSVDTYTGGALTSWNSETEYQIRDDQRTVVFTAN